MVTSASSRVTVSLTGPAARGLAQAVDERLDVDARLAAEAAAHVGHLDADLAEGHAEADREELAHRVGRLGARSRCRRGRPATAWTMARVGLEEAVGDGRVVEGVLGYRLSNYATASGSWGSMHPCLFWLMWNDGRVHR